MPRLEFTCLLDLPSRVLREEMEHWYHAEEYQLEMAQKQQDFAEKNMGHVVRARRSCFAMLSGMACGSRESIGGSRATGNMIGAHREHARRRTMTKT